MYFFSLVSCGDVCRSRTLEPVRRVSQRLVEPRQDGRVRTVPSRSVFCQGTGERGGRITIIEVGQIALPVCLANIPRRKRARADSTCPGGHLANEAACVACVPGRYYHQEGSGGGPSTCEDCPAGKYQPHSHATGGSSCKPCVVDTYSTKGSKSCLFSRGAVFTELDYYENPSTGTVTLLKRR